MADEKLDDVISQLIDDDKDELKQQSTTEPAQERTVSPGHEKAVNLTERAARQVEKIRKDENLGEDIYLRVAVEGGGCSGLSYKLGFDHITDDDELIESQGVEMVIDFRHKLYLDGILIDYPDGLDARGFTFDNPNATETCGCGSSFAT